MRAKLKAIVAEAVWEELAKGQSQLGRVSYLDEAYFGLLKLSMQKQKEVPANADAKSTNSPSSK